MLDEEITEKTTLVTDINSKIDEAMDDNIKRELASVNHGTSSLQADLEMFECQLTDLLQEVDELSLLHASMMPLFTELQTQDQTRYKQ